MSLFKLTTFKVILFGIFCHFILEMFSEKMANLQGSLDV
jgi:hypothetical protein